MANRIILTALVTLALTFSPRLAQSVPTTDSKKKNTADKTQSKVSNKSKAGKSKSYSRSRARQSAPEAETPVRAQMAQFPGAGSPEPSYMSTGVGETPPLMRVTPQRDGRFLLEPLSPKKPAAPAPRPGSQLNSGNETSANASRDYNRFEPWNFSDLILTQARYYRDTPYARGASLANSRATDCSGFVQYIYQNFKICLPRSSAEQAQVGRVVVARNMDYAKLLPGDLLFFSRGGRHIGHAGIYLGEGKMIHASNRRLGVTITDLRQPYYEGTFVVAKRVFEVKYPQ